jgi:glycine cleavage system pyridoxal-binding protein P
LAKIDFRKRTATIRNVEAALDRKLRVEKAIVNICLRYTGVNLKSVVKALLEGDYPVVEGAELNHELAAALGTALENYDDESARKEDVAELVKKWSARARKKALLQKPVVIPPRSG